MDKRLFLQPSVTNRFEQTFKNIDGILHKEAGCDYTEQTLWLLFLKYRDGLEAARAASFQTIAYKIGEIKNKRGQDLIPLAPLLGGGFANQTRALLGAT